MLFLGASLQQAGLATTSATNGGFLTACYVVLTPFVVWALSRTPAARDRARRGRGLVPRRRTSGGRRRTRHARRPLGDGLVLIADFAWATGIALTPIFLVEDRAAADACVFAICDVRRLRRRSAPPLFERAEPADFLAAAPAILFAGLVSGAIGYTLQIVAQRHTPPAEAALILSMESVFAALAGAIVLGERLTLARRRRLRAHPVRRGRGRGRAASRAATSDRA